METSRLHPICVIFLCGHTILVVELEKPEKQDSELQ